MAIASAPMPRFQLSLSEVGLMRLCNLGRGLGRAAGLGRLVITV
jgi:hypothetical protein